MHRLLSTSLIALMLAACAPSTGDVTPPVSYDFEETGTLTRNQPGLTPGVWYLSYKESGQADLTMRLSFDDNSECLTGTSRGACERSIFENNLAVTIRGTKDGNGVLVGEMEVER